MACFEDLSDDVLHLVFSYLRPECIFALRCFRLVSKRLSLFADSVLYRTTIFRENNILQEQATYHTIERLLDPKDVLRQVVRFLHVDSFRGDNDSCCMNTQLLLACMHSIRKLDSFSWNSKTPLPASLLSALHHHHPEAQLCVSLNSLDQAATSSTQLSHLSFSMPCSDIGNPDSIAPLEELKRILIQTRSLRTLTFDVHQDPILRERAEQKTKQLEKQARDIPLSLPPQPGLPGDAAAADSIASLNTGNGVQIPLRETDQLPPLEELNLKASTYKLDEYQHFRRLYRSLAWERLKRLSVGRSNPDRFFEFFTGRMPLLEHLEFCYHSTLGNHFNAYYTSQAALEKCSKFIASLDKLQTLIIRCDMIDFSDQFWQDLANTHGKSLQGLSLLARSEGLDPPICRNSPLEFLIPFFALKTLHLTLSTSTLQQACPNCPENGHTLSTEYIDTIPYLPSLQTLQLSIRVSSCGHIALHSYIANHAHCAVRRFWANYIEVSSNHNLELVKLDFWRWETPSAHPDEYGITHGAHIHTIAFDSVKRGSQLIVKERDDRKIYTTFYDEARLSASEGCDSKVIFVLHKHDDPQQLRNLRDQFCWSVWHEKHGQPRLVDYYFSRM